MGLPIFGISNYSNPQWVPEPNGRGTWGLVQTCLLTLGLCVYSAVHLNVFHRECNWWTRFLIRCKWLIVALLAPEFIVFNAWSQRRQAIRIARILRRRCNQGDPVSPIMKLWARARPMVRDLDPESSHSRERQPAGRPSERRIRCLEGEGNLSQSITRNLEPGEPQEQGKAQKSSGIERTETSLEVRCTSPFLE